MINRDYVETHKLHILLILQDLRKIFHLGDVSGIIREYNSIGKLNDAFGENVVYANPSRKRDMAEILYAFLYFFHKRRPLLFEADQNNRFFMLDLLIVHLMPTAWSYEWQDDGLRNSIDPFLEEYSPRESRIILKTISFLADTGILGYISSEQIGDVIVYWEKMACHREQLIRTPELIQSLHNDRITWNPYLEMAKVEKAGSIQSKSSGTRESGEA